MDAEERGAGSAGREPHQRRRGAPLRPFSQLRGHSLDRGALEENAQGELDAEGLLDAGEEPGGEKRVAAQVEEAVVDADPLDAQEVAPDSGQPLFLGRAGEHDPAFYPLGRGRGQAVELAGAGQGKGREGHHGSGRQVGRGEARPGRSAGPRR